MYEAIIHYDETFTHRLEANSIEQLREKCKRYISDEGCYEITVIKPEIVGYFRSPFDIELL